MIEDIVTPQPGLKVYPPDTDVFAEPDAALARHLHPLVSIDLATVDPSWQGWIHLLSPVEPYDGLVGQDTAAYHNDYLRANWIGFRLDDNNRYTLLGDPRYFYLETRPPRVTQPIARNWRRITPSNRPASKLRASGSPNTACSTRPTGTRRTSAISAGKSRAISSTSLADRSAGATGRARRISRSTTAIRTTSGRSAPTVRAFASSPA